MCSRNIDFMIESDVVEEHQMLMQLPHVADVGHDWQTNLLGHQADGKKLADTAEPVQSAWTKCTPP